ncbi:bifunctional tryptophan synthase trp1 [Quaeritorhiza haematococci]|nr:bifunctional tryptophan synthase trp1 [Quaeritorhiza haematococci]
MTTVLIDNYDSFTWNVYQYLSDLGANVVVFRNDQITVEEVVALKPRNVVVSPGPGRPASAGISMDIIRAFEGKVPILGVCLGEQCMYEVYGGVVTYAGKIVHGKTSPVRHDGKGLYEGVPQNVEVTRYHSLAGDPKTLPSESLEITSWTEDGIVMGVRHKKFVMEGVQFHPESIASEHGKRMIANFLKWEGGTWDTLKVRNDLVKWDRVGDGSGDGGGGGGGGAGGKRGLDSSTDGIPVSKISKLNSTGTPRGTSNGSSTTTTHHGQSSVTTTAPETTEKTNAPSILKTIADQRIRDVADAKSKEGQSTWHLERSLALGLAPRQIDFYARLLRAATPVAVLAEVKRASPSKGDIDKYAHAPTQALQYAAGGAAVISVLTEPKWFKGSLNDMRLVREALDQFPGRPAVLRKDFIVDPYQIYEARLNGADTILLIVAILTDERLVHFMELSRSLGMEPLVEVANRDEMKRAITHGARVIGVNNRDLHTFNVDMGRTSALAGLVPQGSGVILLALSGITGREDVVKYMSGGAKGVLVGEALMRAKDKKVFIRMLLGKDGTSGSSPTKAGVAGSKKKEEEAEKQKQEQKAKEGVRRTLVKICGVTSPEDALAAARAGADLIGLIFAPSPRQVTVQRAKEIITAVKSELFLGSAADAMAHTVSLPFPGPEGSATSPSDWYSSTHTTIENDLLLLQASHRPLFVGVFSNAKINTINETIASAGLDLVQFHGDESPRLARLVRTPVIKAFHVHVGEEGTGLEVRKRVEEAAGSVAVVLLDTAVRGKTQQGGTGAVFDWGIAAVVQGRRGKKDEKAKGGDAMDVDDDGQGGGVDGDGDIPIILAGGLTPENVAEAVRTVKPWCVDVSSGVEAKKGVKDHEKVKKFVEAVRQCV